MPNEKVKEHLIQAAVRLLTENGSHGKITARQIAAEADVNLAMINYYFKSKDELINTAVGKIIEERALILKEIMAKDITAKQKLIEFFITMSDIMVEYLDITRPTVPFLLLEGEIGLPVTILPLVKECYHNRKTEGECRMAAYQMISFSQLILYRYKDFTKYSGMDIMDKKQREQCIRSMITLFFND